MYSILEQLLDDKGITAYQLSKATGISTATFSSWKGGKYTPKDDKLQLIANYFGVTLEYLKGESQFKTKEEMFLHWDNQNKGGELINEIKTIELVKSQYGKKVVKLIENFTKLDDVDQIRILERIDMLLEDEKYDIKKESLNA